MKRFTAILLALALALALTGCGAERTAYVEAQSAKAEGYDAARSRLAGSGCSEGFISMLTADELEFAASADSVNVCSEYFSLSRGTPPERISAGEYAGMDGKRMMLTIVILGDGDLFRMYAYAEMPEPLRSRQEQCLGIDGYIWSYFCYVPNSQTGRAQYTAGDAQTVYEAEGLSAGMSDFTFTLPRQRGARDFRALFSVDTRVMLYSMPCISDATALYTYGEKGASTYMGFEYLAEGYWQPDDTGGEVTA